MNIAIFGATSAIAQATAQELLAHHTSPLSFFLIGRNRSHLETISADLLTRGAQQAEIFDQDLSLADQMDSLTTVIWQKSGGIDIALIAHGALPNQEEIQDSWPEIRNAYDTNALSYMAIMTSTANLMAERRTGSIAVISSVAGDRGRKSNYIYGSAKGAVSLFTQGLRNRFSSDNVHIMTIKPGLVDSPMTSDFEKGGFLWSTPKKIAEVIVRGLAKKREVIYAPSYWFFVMTIIKSIPEILFKRLSL